MAAKKFSHSDPAEHNRAVRMLGREFRALERVDHPNIVRLHGVVIDEPSWSCLLMELSPCGSLRKVLGFTPEQLLYSPAMQVAVAQDVARAMTYLHSQKKPILHHDLKSDNVLLWQHAERGFFAKIADFGMSTRIGVESTMGTSAHEHAGGTLAYKAPESFDGKFTQASEVYSFSIMLWELITAKRPWRDPSGNPYTLAVVLKAVVSKKERPPITSIEELHPLAKIMQQCWEQVPSKRPTFRAIEDLLMAAVSRDLLSSKRSYIKKGRRLKTAPTYTPSAPVAPVEQDQEQAGPSEPEGSSQATDAQPGSSQAPDGQPGSIRSPDARPEIQRWLQMEEEDTAEYQRAEALALAARPPSPSRRMSRDGVLTFRHAFSSGAQEGAQPASAALQRARVGQASAALQRARAAGRIRRTPGINPAPGLTFNSV